MKNDEIDFFALGIKKGNNNYTSYKEFIELVEKEFGEEAKKDFCKGFLVAQKEIIYKILENDLKDNNNNLSKDIIK